MNTFVETSTLLEGLVNDITEEQKKSVEDFVEKVVTNVSLKSELMITILDTFDSLLSIDLDLLATSSDTIPKFQYLEKQCYTLYKEDVLTAGTKSSGTNVEKELSELSNLKYVEDMLRSLDTIKWEGHHINLEEGGFGFKGGLRYKNFIDNPKEHIDILAKGIVILNKIITDKIKNEIPEKLELNTKNLVDTEKLLERYKLYSQSLVADLREKEEDLFLTDSQTPKEFYFEDEEVLFPRYFYEEKESLLEMLGQEIYTSYFKRFIKEKELVEEVEEQLLSVEVVDGVSVFLDEEGNPIAEEAGTEDGILW